MTTELYYLGWVALITMLMWIPPGIDLSLNQGLGVGLGNRDDVRPLSPWAERAKRAHHNTVENLVVFAPLVLALHFAGKGSATTASAVMIYFWARLAYYLVYTFGIIGVRTAIWTVAWLCQIVIAWQLLA